MKKLLLLLALTFASFAEAQLLQSEDFNSLVLGDVGTDITGVTPGQGGWLTFSTNGAAPTTGTNAGNTNFEIIDNGFENTNGLIIRGSNGNKGSRFMWKPDFAATWDTRTAGNDIIEVEYDMYTGPATTSTAQFGVRLFGLDGTTSRVLNGFVYNANTRVLQGVAYLNNAGTFGTFLVNLAAAPGLILEENTWYRIGFGYDTLTGAPLWNTGDGTSGIAEANWAGPFLVEEVDFVSGTPTTNNTEAYTIFDNLTVKATATEGLLSIAEIAAEESSLTVYPNPAKGFITISDITSLQSVELFEMNGRSVKRIAITAESSNIIDLSDVSSGVYLMKMVSEKGIQTKKIVVE